MASAAYTYRPKSSEEIIGKKKNYSSQAALIYEHIKTTYNSEIVLDPNSNFATIKIPRAIGKKGKTIPLLTQDIIKKYPELLKKEHFGSKKINLKFGDGSVGGGGGARGGSEVTALVESLQCYYNSYYFTKGISAEEPDLKELKSQQACCFTDRTLESAWSSDLVKSWIDGGVFIKIAKKLHSTYRSKFSGKVTFHRGSKFMKDIYIAKKKVHDQDKELAVKSKTSPQAPGSFSNDKWNPGDIWMTNIPNADNAMPFAKHTCNWGSLNKAVEKYAKDGINGGKVLGVSLKRVNGPQANITPFNDHKLDKVTQTYRGFTFGAGDFFNSKDCYLVSSGGKMQFRATDVEKNWQGEISAASAAGGKIGGGNVNFYLNDVYKKQMWGSAGETTAIQNALTSITTPNSANAKKFIEENWKLYESLISQQMVQDPKNPKNREDWETLYAEKDHGWRSSKYLCMKMLEIIYGDGSVQKRDHLLTLFYLYAASNSDQSSFFIKIAD